MACWLLPKRYQTRLLGCIKLQTLACMLVHSIADQWSKPPGLKSTHPDCEGSYSRPRIQASQFSINHRGGWRKGSEQQGWKAEQEKVMENRGDLWIGDRKESLDRCYLRQRLAAHEKYPAISIWYFKTRPVGKQEPSVKCRVQLTNPEQKNSRQLAQSLNILP